MPKTKYFKFVLDLWNAEIWCNEIYAHSKSTYMTQTFSFYKTHDDCSILFSEFSQAKSKVQTNVVCVDGLMKFMSNPCKCITQDVWM